MTATDERTTPTEALPLNMHSIRVGASTLERLTDDPPKSGGVDAKTWAEPIARESAAFSDDVAHQHENNPYPEGRAGWLVHEARALLAGINATALLVAEEGSRYTNKEQYEAGEDEWFRAVQILSGRLSMVADELAEMEEDHG